MGSLYKLDLPRVITRKKCLIKLFKGYKNRLYVILKRNRRYTSI